MSSKNKKITIDMKFKILKKWKKRWFEGKNIENLKNDNHNHQKNLWNPCLLTLYFNEVTKWKKFAL